MYAHPGVAMNHPTPPFSPRPAPANADETSRYVDPDAAAAERTYALFTHLVGLLSLTTAGIPFLGLIGTGIMWAIKRAESPFLDDHGRQAVNFQISLLIYYVVGGFVLVVFGIVTFGIGAILLPVAMLGFVALSIIGSVRGAMASHRGEYYRYPMTIQFLRGPTDWTPSEGRVKTPF